MRAVIAQSMALSGLATPLRSCPTLGIAPGSRPMPPEPLRVLAGETETLGGRHIPFSIVGLDGESRVPGVLESHEIKGTAPLLLSLYAQAQLGICKDLRTNLYGVRLPSSDRLIPIQMYVTKDSGLLCINLTDGLVLKKQPKLLRSYKIPDPPVSLNARASRYGSRWRTTACTA